MTFDEAKAQVADLLALANGDADAVFRSLTRAQRAGADSITADRGDEERRQFDYGLMRLALADLTGHAAYRL